MKKLLYILFFACFSFPLGAANFDEGFEPTDADVLSEINEKSLKEALTTGLEETMTNYLTLYPNNSVQNFKEDIANPTRSPLAYLFDDVDTALIPNLLTKKYVPSKWKKCQSECAKKRKRRKILIGVAVITAAVALSPYFWN